MRIWLSLAMLGALLGACAGGPGVGEEEIAGGRASGLPPGFAAGTYYSNPAGIMLPAGKTATEAAATSEEGRPYWQDPRDGEPAYAFTAVPGDVLKLPAEFGEADKLLIAWSDGSWDLKPFFVDLIAAAVGYVAQTVVFYDSMAGGQELKWALVDAGVDLSSVTFLRVSLDSIWIRDYGPLLVKTSGNGRRVVDMRYYYGRWYDDQLPNSLADHWNLPTSRPPLEAEGGNLQSDGAGTCITTEYLVEQNAFMGYTKSKVAQILDDYLGCTKTVFLPTLDGEGTGHVDMLATITGVKQALVGKYDVSDDPINAQRLDKAASLLTNAGFTVTRLPMPTNIDGAFRSYTNSLALGNAVLVPTYRDDRRFEAQALALFAKAYPGRDIVPIDSTQIIQWAGAVHCVTMTMDE